MVVLPAFFSSKRRKLYFVINVLNNKTIILLNQDNLNQAIFRAISQDNG